MRPFPLYAERAAGARKWDADGHELIDYVMGHGALMLGHNYPSVMEAAQAQLALGTHYGASTLKEIEWAEEVTRTVPSAEVVRFTSSGTEATLMALRLARTYGKAGSSNSTGTSTGGTTTWWRLKYSAGAPAGVQAAGLHPVPAGDGQCGRRWTSAGMSAPSLSSRRALPADVARAAGFLQDCVILAGAHRISWTRW
jgi:hypothetical protein